MHRAHRIDGRDRAPGPVSGLAVAPRLARILVVAAVLSVAPRAQDAAPAEPPAVRGEDYESAWPYLRDKYDTDHDGRIERREYARDDEAFERLDRDGDGAVTEEDLLRGNRQGMGPMLASVILRAGFDTDGDDTLRRAEMASRFATLDADADGRLSRAELDAAFLDVPDDGGLLGRMSMDRFGLLAEQADDDGDLLLSRDELRTLFERLDRDRDGALAPPGGGHRARGGGDREEHGDRGDTDRAERGTGQDAGRGVEGGTEPEPPAADDAPNAVGRVAPDFTLARHGGEGEPVTLSAFAGERPVALIFGSYT